jgi:hypothetical protein
MYDSVEEITSRNNNIYQLWKYLEKNFGNVKYDNPFKIFDGLPFYRFDLTPEEHKKLYLETRSRCCFNHFIGLPEKDGKRFPLFDYQREVFDDFMKSWNNEPLSDGVIYRFFAILKATGLGFTEIMIRLMAWVATTSNQFRGKRFGIIAGIRMEIVDEIMSRLVGLFSRFPFLGIKRIRNKVNINGVMVEGYPAGNALSLRSYANFAFILVDEADFFDKSLQKEVRTGVERYIAKSNPFVYFVSTPNKPNGMFYEIFSRPQSDTFYKQYKFDYKVGVGHIFTEMQIEEQKKSEFFEREYNLQFGGLSGNYFSTNAVNKNIVNKELANELEFAPFFFYKDIAHTNEDMYLPKSLGIDPGFGSNPGKDIGSYTGLCLTQFRNGRVEVIYAEELIQPDYDELVRIVDMIITKTNTTKVYIDGSNPALVKSIKNTIGEYPHYEKYDKEEMERKINGSMIVCPIPFNVRTKKEMLSNLKEFVDRGLLTIHEKQRNMIDALTSTWIEDGKIDKEKTAHDDLLDALQLSMRNYMIKPKVSRY